jgi:tRNA (adenine57-N1/adenine58-N1)-methyltransferase
LSIGSTDLIALRPTLAEYIQELPRSTQIVYPKDIGVILIYADIFPGARVVEAGLGSGALTLAALRAVGPQGCVTSYEIRPELVKPAMDNIRAVMQEPPLNIRVGDIYQGIVEESVDRILLDLPEPWHVVPHAARALSPGGILLCFLPTVLQVHRLVEAMDEHTEFDLIESFEVIMRPWHVDKRSIRPVHRMIGHTGFVTTARHCAPGRLFRRGRIRSDGTLNPNDSLSYRIRKQD